MKTFYQYLQEQTPQQNVAQPGSQQQVQKPGTQQQMQNQQQNKPGTQQPQIDVKKVTDAFNALKQLLGPLGIK